MKKYTYLVLTLLFSTNLTTLTQPPYEPYEVRKEQPHKKNATSWGALFLSFLSGALIGTGITYYTTHTTSTSSQDTTRLNNEIRELKASLQQQGQQQSDNEDLNDRIEHLTRELKKEKEKNELIRRNNLQQQGQQQSNNQDLNDRIEYLTTVLKEERKKNELIRRNNLQQQGQQQSNNQDLTSENSQDTWECTGCTTYNTTDLCYCKVCGTNRLNPFSLLPQQGKELQSNLSHLTSQKNKGTYLNNKLTYSDPKNNPNLSLNNNPNNNRQNLYRNNSKKRKWPEEDNKVTLSNTNQFQHGGTAACLHAASKLLKEHLQDREKSLYDTALLNQICQKGANMLQNNIADELYDIFDKYKNTYNFKLVSTGELNIIPMGEGNDIEQPNPLNHKNELEQEIRTGTDLGYNTALVRNGPEAWALIVHPDKTISIFDSHGRENTGRCAYIKHFNKVNELTKYVWDYNPLLNGELDTAQDMGGLQKDLYSLYVYWVGQG